MAIRRTMLCWKTLAEAGLCGHGRSALALAHLDCRAERRVREDVFRPHDKRHVALGMRTPDCAERLPLPGRPPTAPRLLNPPQFGEDEVHALSGKSHTLGQG